MHFRTLRPVGSASGHKSPAYKAIKTRDDYVVVACSPDNFWKNLCKAIGREEWSTNPKYDSALARGEHQEEIVAMLEEIFLTKKAEEWLKILVEADVPCSLVNTIDKVVADPQVLHQNMVITVNHPRGPQLKMVGNPIKMSAIQEQVFPP